MRQARQRLQRADNISRVSKEIVTDIQFVQFLESGHIGGQKLQSIAVERQAFQILELGQDGHHQLQIVDLSKWTKGYLNSRFIILRSLSACSSSRRSFIYNTITAQITHY